MALESLGEVLTNATGNRLDFFNIGGLAKQRTRETIWGLWNHYSWRELFIRGGIITSTILLGVLAADTCNDEFCSSLTRGLVGAGVGFFVSHAVAVIPTIKRRNEIKNTSLNLYNSIQDRLTVLQNSYNPDTDLEASSLQIVKTINFVSSQCLNLVLPVTKRGDAVNNLITIKKLLSAIDEKTEHLISQLNDPGCNNESDLLFNAEQFWSQDFNTLKEQLLKKNNEIHNEPVNSLVL